MHTFPSLPSLQHDEYTRLLPNSHGISVDDSSLDVGNSTFVTFRNPDDVANDQRSLTAALDERRRQLAVAREDAWSPLDLATLVHHCVPRSANVDGMLIFFISSVIL